MAVIREEEPGDAPAIWHVNEQAFGRTAEPDLVDALRQNGGVTLSLVAVEGDQIVGHALFSPVTIDGDNLVFPAVALGPLAVLPTHQGQGIGSELVRAGQERCREEGWRAAILLGHPSYYPRFGFVPSVRYGIRYEHDVPEDAFMVIELKEGALSGVSGTVKYRPEFSGV